MQSRWVRPGEQRCYKHGSILPVIGLVLIAAGLLLVFLCIPGWAWAALAGIALIVAGYVLIRLGRRGR